MVATLVLRMLLALALAAPPPGAGVRRALEALHAWDAARAAAYGHADTTALRALYVAGSSAGTADVALLRAYTARGYRVTVLRPQVFSVSVLPARAGRLRLRLVDRVTGAVQGPHGCALLPADPPRLRTVELRRVAGGWRVASVRLGAGPRVSYAGRGPRR